MKNRNRFLLGVAAGALGLFVLVSLLRSGIGTDAGPITGPRSTASEREIAPRLEEPESAAPPREDSTIGIVPTSPPAAPSAGPKDEPMRDLLALPEGTIAEMQAKRDALNKLLGELSQPILSQRFDDNLAETVATRGAYTATERDMTEIWAIRRAAGGEEQPWYRAALPRSDYPELYELKDAGIRLDKQIGKMQVQQELARKKD